MDIGRKIYYQVSTGNVLVDCGERSGSVIETTIDQDFAFYTALQGVQESSIGVIRCDYGYMRDNFMTYPYHIDITKNPIDETAIVWDINNPYGASLADVQTLKLTQIDDLYNQTLLAGFGSNGSTFKYDYRSQIDFLKMDVAIKDGMLSFPVSIPNVSQQPVQFTQDQYTQFKSDMAAFDLDKQNKLDTLCNQVKACTTVDEVNAIVVSFN